MSEELKPCPFGCDQEELVLYSSRDVESGHDYGFTINCAECGIEMSDEYRDELIRIWNTRTEIPSEREEVVKWLRRYARSTVNIECEIEAATWREIALRIERGEHREPHMRQDGDLGEVRASVESHDEEWPPTLEGTLQKIYDAEVNVTISTIWDGGYDIGLGGAAEYAPPQHEWNVDHAHEIEPWLRQAFNRFYPLAASVDGRRMAEPAQTGSGRSPTSAVPPVEAGDAQNPPKG
jgi:hypothetical protein